MEPGGFAGACSSPTTGRPGIALPPGSALPLRGEICNDILIQDCLFGSPLTTHTIRPATLRLASERPSTTIDDRYTAHRVPRAGFRRPHRRTESPAAAASGGCQRVARFTGYKIRLEWARCDHTEGSYGGLKRTMSGGSNRPSLLLRCTFSYLACECMYEDRIVVC